MDSWTLQGDSYSLLHSAPCRPFTLCHRDGTPNHVEIFDITSSPSQRSAISETTCLCDIFGDDCESPSASSNAAVGSFVHSQTEVERTTVVSPLVDDLNDSSGSYHTAPGSTEGEEGFEDLTERIYSPALQGESTECEQLEQTIVSSELSKDSSSNFELKSKSPIPQLNAAGPLSEFDNTDFRERTPSPGHNSSSSLCSQETFLCYSSAETSCSPPLLHPGCEQGRLTPVLKSTINNSLPHQFLTQSPSCEPMNCSTSSSSESVNTQSQLKETEPQPRSTHLNKNISASPGPTHTDYASQSSNVESVADLSSHLPSSGYTESQSGKALLSSELNYSSSLADTQASSPLNKLRGRVFLPDLLSRGSTPDVEIEKSPHSCESTKDLSTTEINFKSSQFGTNIPTASPRYTPPSPVISVSPSPVDSGVVPELKHTSPSPDLLSAPSALHKSGSRTSSPGLSSHSSAFSEVITEACSSVINYSLSPSPGIKSTCSSIESTCTAPSPEIRITASSPEIKRRDYISEEQTIPDSPLFESAPSRSLTSSPHITGISYPAVRSEEGITPPLPELCRLPTPGSDITRTSPMRRSTSPSKAGTPQYSSPVSGFSGSELHTEITHSRSRTSSPQSMRCTPSPELRYQSLNSSSELRSRDPSPATPSLANKYNQHSLSTLCSKYNAHYLQPTPPLETSEGVTSSLPNQHIELETQGVQRAFELDKEDKASETKSSSPVVLIQSPVSNLPFLTEEKVDHALIQQHPQDKLTQNKVPVAGLASFSAENLDTGPINHFNSPTIKCKSFPPNCLFTNKGRAHRISNKAKSLQREEKRLNQHTYNSFKSNFTSDHSRQKLGERARFAQNMAHHVNRRKTPSPPLTRFTPVHIIAPEKPRRQWQNRCHSDFVASSQGGYLKKTVSNRESPDIVPPDNNSQLHSVQLGKQLEVERKMQLEKKRERERGIEREYHREGREIEKGEEWQKDVSYREQVELSFNAKNRKGPASHSTAPTNTESCQGLSTVHSYPESLLTTRQPQEQESRLKLASQRDKSGGPPRRFQNPALQNKFSPRSVTNRPGRSSSSSMGSELDEADNEVKWLTDVAFRSLSSPEVDYLDMYNSSHRSSTNISQPSTQESPAGIIGAWPTYADFRGSASKLDSDDLSFQQQSLYHSDGIDPARCYEMGSFECIDVAVEREDTRNFRRGVPKRQIQLKRKERVDDGSENTSPGLPAMENSPSLERHSKEALLRQYSTPAAGQEGYGGHDGGHHDRKAKLQKSISLDETSSKTKMATCLIKSVLSKKMQSADKQLHDPDGDEVNTTFGQNNIYEENHECDKLNSSLCSNYSNPCEDFAMKEEQSQRDDIRPPKSYGEKSNRPSSNSRIKISNLSHTDNQQWGSQDCNTSATSEIRSKLRVPSDSSQSIGGIQHVDDSKTWQGRESGDSANTIAGNKGAPSALGAFSTQTRMTSQHQECENTEVHKQLQQGDKSRHMTQENRLQGGKKKKASLNVCLTPEAENNRDKSSPDMHFKQQEEKVKETNVDLQTEEENRSEDNKLKGPIHKVRDVRRLVKNTYNLSFKAPSCVSPSDITEERIGHLDETNKNEIKENVKENLKGRTVELCEERTNKCMGERKEAKKVEGKDEKLSTLPSTLQTEGKPLSQLQPMQIQCKAVCLKDDKNKIQSHKDIGNHGGKTLGSTNTEQDKNPSKTDTEGGMQEPSARGTTTKSQQRNFNMDAESLKTDSEERSVLVGTDTKDPMLGSLPKLPSKEREVSTAVVLIRDGSSQAKTCAPLTQEEVPTLLQAASSPEITTTGSTPSSSSHSVSMLLKEKGYRADIGAVVGDSQNRTGGKGVPHKHVNCLEIPLQMPSDDGAEPNREETFSASSTVPSPSLVSDYVDKPPKSRDKEGGCIKEKTISPQGNPPDQLSTLNKHKEHTDFEVMKRQDPTFHPRSPATRRFKPQPIEVKSLSKETPKQEMITKSPINRPQTIEVKSIAKNSEKPAVPPKPTCKFKPADLGAKTNEVPASAMPNVKPQIEERPQTIVVSSPTIYRKIPSESSSMSNQTRKLAVSAVSSLKPPPSKITKTTVSSVTNQTASSSGTEASKTQQQHPWTAHVRLAHATTATSIPLPSIPSIEGPNSDPVPKHVPEPSSTEARHTSQPVVVEQNLHEAAVTTSSNNPKPPAAVSTTQALGYTHQQYCRSLSSERTQRAGDPHFYASDDPPSYDERESFSPLMPDLTHRRSNRYQNRSYPPSCSCTAGCPPQPALPPPAPHHHHSPHNLTPPAPPHSPGHVLPYQASQPLVRPHQCRADPQPMSFQPSSSPKPSPHGPSHPPTMYQPLHLPPPCPPHPSLMPVDRTMPSDSRRLPPHRSPQQHQPPSMPGAPYSDPIHSHSPGLAPMEHQYMCGQYGSEYGGDTSSLYSESSYGPTPRRVLLDPETGKYFYIELPMQPLRKMLFDPETGQYVEVLIPQQGVSHSGLYPPSAAPYTSLHNTNMYGSAPQYMPFSAPPPTAHPQAQHQPPRYPEALSAATMHPNGLSGNYRSCSGQGSKPDATSHLPLDQNYLEGMYYVPTGINAGSNTTLPVYYHKHPPSLPPSGGKKS